MLVRSGSLLAAVAVLIALAGCGGDGDERVQRPAPPSPFAYDAEAPLQLRDRGVLRRVGRIAIRDISYASPRGGRVPGLLVVPSGRGPHPAVIYLHGAGGDRLQFLPEALAMAKRGAVGLTIDAPETRAGARPPGGGIAGVRKAVETAIQTVVDVRRAVDVLDSLPRVDATRIALVGWSAGARAGAVVAGVEHRVKAFDLIAGGAAPVRVYTAVAPPHLRGQVRQLLAKTDPLRHVARASPSELLFQAGRRDEVVPRAALVALMRAGSEPKEVRWYDSGHRPSARALLDSRRWLARELGLARPAGGAKRR